MGITGLVHAGVVVEDLDAVVEFLTTLGLECSEPMMIEGEWVDRIINLDGTRVEVVMVRLPDGTDALELAKFHTPLANAGAEPAPPPNLPGIRHIAFAVDDMNATVDRVRAAGWDTVGDVVDYRGMYLLCYVRGPEGLIMELAERLGS